MRPGRREKPVISLASIEAALKGFGYGSRDFSEAATLQSLALVDLRLAQASRPSAEDLRAYTVQIILADFLQDGLNEQRRLFDLAPVHEKASRKEAEKALAETLTKNSFSLKAWSCLYYRYLRADLGFSVEEIATALGFGTRNFPRHESDGLLLLRDKLIAAEWEARKLILRRFLQRGIPESLVHLIGRETVIELATSAFAQNPPMPVFITGAEGIGKSALAASLTKTLIENDALDYLIWLSRPKHLEEIYNALEDALLPYPSRTDWRALLGDDKLLLVLDDISQLKMSGEEWEALAGLLSSSYLILTNREYKPGLQRSLPLPLKELDSAEAESFIENYAPKHPLLDKIALEELGGNPRFLSFAAQQLIAGYRPDRAVDSLRLFYEKLFMELDDSAKMAWLGVAAGLDCFDESLLAKAILSLGEIAPSARIYIIWRYSEDKSLAIHFHDYLRDKASLNTLSLDWLKLDDEWRLTFLESYSCKTIPELRQWTRLMYPYKARQADLNFAIALRCLNHPEAESYLKAFIQDRGQKADFAQQAAGRYELALLYQSQSHFELALSHYQAIEAYKQLDDKLRQNIYLQRARIAIERGDGTLALHHLQKRHPNYRGAEDMVLESEAYLLLGEAETSQTIALRALKTIADKPLLAASLHTILGRSYQAEQAIDHFNAALSLSEQFNSDFDIARAKTNLAEAYANYTQDYDDAESLLGEARKIQIRIQDALGLSVTKMSLKRLQALRLGYKK